MILGESVFSMLRVGLRDKTDIALTFDVLLIVTINSRYICTDKSTRRLKVKINGNKSVG